jgi:hypothetical protein
MSWSPIAKPQNWILLQNRRSPGVADVSGAALLQRLDVRKMMGMSGGIIVWTGQDLCPFVVKLRLYEQEHWDAWEAWKPIVLAKPKIVTGVAPGAVVSKALDIQHPLLEQVGIRAAVVHKVTQSDRTHEAGEWTITINFIEFRGAPKMQMAKAEGSKSTPTDPVDQYIDQLAAQRDALAKRP